MHFLQRFPVGISLEYSTQIVSLRWWWWWRRLPPLYPVVAVPNHFQRSTPAFPFRFLWICSHRIFLQDFLEGFTLGASLEYLPLEFPSVYSVHIFPYAIFSHRLSLRNSLRWKWWRLSPLYPMELVSRHPQGPVQLIS